MSEREREQAVSTMSNNSGFLTESVMRYRLDTKELLLDIEMQLRGQQVEYERDPSTGSIVEVIKTAGTKKMNDEGIQSIISYLRSVVGPHTVQGNFDEESLEHLIYEIDVTLSTNLMGNLHKWGVDELDYDHIMNTIMHAVIPFLSRTVNNEERKSYAATMRSSEVNSVERRGGFSFPNFGKT